ncbi:DUF1870 family protein [Galbitalea sp. SE-J8]|uniref:Aca2/YdiL-like domain-containing protein n=1 Tax=Galbitalea sp. SE-J8 TaxID=3054952 RepID=UPI00259D0766|nr:DUF1870 family protein [Galbitalea sp. SE-J8]MDM4761899.1 DUF1870 family protein [Galbitalea sp. SE-J8]
MDRMKSGELQTVREYLGLTSEALAGILSVRNDTIRKWESGREPIPHRVREELERIEAYTAQCVGDVVQELRGVYAADDVADPAVIVYRTDAELHAARPGFDAYTARWWRHIVARAATEVPGVVIGTHSELEEFRSAHLYPGYSSARDHLDDLS